MTLVSLKSRYLVLFETINASLNIILFVRQLFVIKEGVQYKVRIDFIVQREIVHGLKYVQKTSRLGVNGECDLLGLFC